MSYDLWFYRSADGSRLTLEELQLLAGERSDRAQLISHDEVLDALRGVFGSELVTKDDGIHGHLFSILLEPAQTTTLVVVNCAWLVTKRPDVYERLVLAGVKRLGASCYDPQRQRHRDAAEQLPEPPTLAPPGECSRLANEFARLGINRRPATEAVQLKAELADLRRRFPDDPAVAQFHEKVLRSYPD